MYYIKPNPPLFFRQQNMQWSRNMVHSHFTLCLRAQDYITWLSQHPWYGLWMRVKGPHHYKVMALGSCVKWPLVACFSNHIHLGMTYIQSSKNTALPLLWTKGMYGVIRGLRTTVVNRFFVTKNMSLLMSSSSEST